MLVAALVLLALLVTVVPALVGGRALTVLSSSMSPTIPAGSVVVVRPVPPDTLREGDVITFSATGESLVTHRIVGVHHGPDGLSLTTRGDANEVIDAHRVTPDEVVGLTWYHLPWIGHLHGRLPQLLLLGGGGVLLVVGVGALRSVVHPPSRGGDRHGRS